MTTLEDATLQAEALVRSYCGWHVTPVKTETLTLDGTGSVQVMLPSLHVADVTAVTTDGDAVSEFDWSKSGIVELRSGCTTRRYQGVTVALVHGYEEWPADIAAVIAAAAARAVANPRSVVRRQAGPFAETYSQTGFNQTTPMVLLDAERSILDRYKLPPRP